MSSRPIRNRSKILQLSLTCAAVALSTVVLGLQNVQPQSGQKLKQQPNESVANFTVQLVNRTPVPHDVIPKWCYEKTPEFIYFDQRSLLRTRLDGGSVKLAEFDRPADNSSLVCSTDGKTILFLSAQQERAYIYDGGRFAEYVLPSPLKWSVRFGSLMSPDGSTVALPSDLQHVQGPDLIKSKRLVNVSNPDVFWTDRYVFHRDRGNLFSVLSFSELKHVSTIAFDDRLIDGIYECGRDAYVLLYSDNYDNRYLTRLETGSFQPGEILINSDNIGSVDAVANVCLVGVAKVSEIGLSITGQLVLLSGSIRKSADVSRLQFANKFFSLSKNREYLVSFQTNALAGRQGGWLALLRLSDQSRR